VQALRWLKDTLPTDRDRIVTHLSTLLADRRHGRTLRDNLRAGLATLPAWLQGIARDLLGAQSERSVSRRRHRSRTVVGKSADKTTMAVRP
jgi:hypothetical protein